MFPRALYRTLPFAPSDTSGGDDADGDDNNDDAGGGGDDTALKDKPSGDERGVLDHLDTKKDGDDDGDDDAGDKDDDKPGADKDKDGDDDKPPTLVFKDRPDWLPENFWDEKTGEAKVEELAKSQKDLRAKISKGGDKVPGKAEDYKLDIGEDLKEIEGRALMDGTDDPLLKWFRDAAKENDLNEEIATNLYAGFLRIAGDLLPEPIDPQQVVKNLGPNGLGVLKHTNDFADNLLKIGVLSDDEHNAMMSWFQDETDIKAFQKMREFYGETAPPMGHAVPKGTQSRDELRAKMGEVLKKADAGDQTASAEYDKLMVEYKKTYGEEPAGTSMPG